MPANIFTKSIRDRWTGTVIATVSLALILLFAMSIYDDVDLNIYTGMPDVVKTTVYVTDLDQFPKLNAVYAEYFATHKPARAVIAVKDLPRNALVEVKCIAQLG